MHFFREPYAPKGIWDQRSFDIFEAVLPQERRDADNQRLTEIFSYAAKVPVAAQALEWAQAHDVRFFIDHKSRGAAAYKPGMGIVTIGLDALNDPETTPADVISFVTHEIRHMWQNYEGWGLINRRVGFAKACMLLNVKEADAFAFQSLAKAQAIYPDRYRTVEEIDRFLSEGFADWFTTHRPQTYGERAARVRGAFYGLAETLPEDEDSELKNVKPHKLKQDFPLNFADEVETLRMIGKTFEGRNYLAGHENEPAVRNIFDLDLALRFHDSARQKPDDLVLAICQHEEQQALRRQRTWLRY